ncbi:hypothetical protein QJS10_CPA03g00752 [Acorus calamus]|uniref:Uncharacterized protein n=1 Tax=Acorus calamus TaxID=4465 RepID=A0AAV9F8X6_ACOCL|nr:hypothetical protein QJS10_CPA03g00752 [Acorus calamus]
MIGISRQTNICPQMVKNRANKGIITAKTPNAGDTKVDPLSMEGDGAISCSSSATAAAMVIKTPMVTSSRTAFMENLNASIVVFLKKRGENSTYNR